MNLVLFDFAIQHITRITRVIKSPNGNALVIGMGGSGRQSLIKLSAFVSEFKIFSIQTSKMYDIGEWQEDLRNLLTQVGVEKKNVVFILRCTDIKLEVFIENVNNILNTGEVPNLFPPDDKEIILDSIKSQRGMSIKSEIERWEYFIENCKKHLKIVLCFSPVGTNLRRRLRSFPSIVNCCYIDWFTIWPHQALIDVSRHYISAHGISEDPRVQEAASTICVNFHMTIREYSTRYLEEQRRYNYVTPNDYLLLLQNCKSLLMFKEETTVKLKKKYMDGVLKLDDTQEMIGGLREKLIKLKPELEQKTVETEETMRRLQKENAEAEKTRTLVSVQQQESAKEAEFAQRMQKECEEALQRAIPDLEAAVAALDTIKKDQINIVRSMQKPPEPIRLSVEAVAIICGEKPVRLQNPQDKSKHIFDYFEAGKKMMQKSNFISRLKKFDRDSITSELISQLQPYLEHPKFEPNVVKYASTAAEGMCKWVRAMVNFFYINEDVKPKQKALEEAKENMAERFRELQLKQDELDKVEKLIEELRNHYEEQNFAKQKLIADIGKCEAQMERALRLMEKLGGERERWSENVKRLDSNMQTMIGDILLSAGVVSYMGTFTGNYREEIVTKEWIPFIQKMKVIPCSPDFNLKDTVGDALVVQNWTLNGLPSDKVSIENAIILQHTKQWPLIIDPQRQAITWLKKKIKDSGVQLITTKPNLEEFFSVLETSIFVGATLILESVGEYVDPILEPLLLKQFYVEDGVTYVNLGDSGKQYDEHFDLYLTTNMANPHYTPEVSTKVTILNFSITQEGLTEQLLTLVCYKELPKFTSERVKLTIQSAEYIKKMQDFEDTILAMLQQSTGEQMIEDEELINSLTSSKRMSEELERRLNSAKINETRIIEYQDKYVPVASISAVLYFCVADLQNIGSMYEFSMEWFNELFKRSLNSAENNKDIEIRIQNLIQEFRQTLYTQICMSLFESDKMIFSFLMSVRLILFNGQITPQELRFLLTGVSQVSEELNEINPFPEWMEDKIWHDINELRKVEGFDQLTDNVKQQHSKWQQFITSTKTHEIIPPFDEFSSVLPPPYNNPAEYSRIQRLLIYRAAKPEEIVHAVRAFIKSEIGEFYLSPPLFSLEASYEESKVLKPLIFILSPGNDPQQILKQFAKEKNCFLDTLSLGKGQGERATKMINNGITHGGWVVLQNCHLALSWMPQLEALIEKLVQDAERHDISPHGEFRLWLTSMPNPNFPASLLQNGVKITNEPPTGLKNNLRQIYSNIANSKDELAFYESSTKPVEWKKLFFGLAFFHCIIRERRKFGSLGWNVFYEFNESDLQISMRQLHYSLDNYSIIPFKALNYLAGKCNYGGRVTDDWDDRTLRSLLADFYTDDILYDNYQLCPIKAYRLPKNREGLTEIISYLETLPNEESPQVFGLHENASITYARKLAQDNLTRLLNLQPRASQSRDKEKGELQGLSAEILGMLKGSFDIKEIQMRYPVVHAQSMNTVLVQEAGRFNGLLKVIKKSLDDLNRALEGIIVITSEIEKTAESMLKNQVPAQWMAASYSSCKPLLSWSKDLAARIKFLQTWVETGTPSMFWISGFFFTQAFLTGTMQNFARKYVIPIDTLEFEFEVRPDLNPDEEGQVTHITPPEDGCYIYGLFLEGAHWDSSQGKLVEPLPRELFSPMPTVIFIQIWLKPHTKRHEEQGSPGRHLGKLYNCPVYKTSKRFGTLLTTGHSTNYVMTVKLQSILPESHWVKRGAALLTQLDT